MRNLNQMNITITKYLKYYLLVFIIGLTSISGFATNTPTIIENVSENVSENETARLLKDPPMVILAKPSQKRMTTLKKRETIKAYVRNIRRKRRVIVRINGKRTRRFKFKKHSGLIKIKAKLDQGENLIEIVAKNRKGEASEVLMVTRELLAGDPSIEIIKPSYVIGTRRNTIGIITKTTEIKTTEVRTSENIILVTAQLQNVEHRDDIVVLVDGLERQFSYHASSGMLRAEINLEVGSNHVVINAYNVNGKKATAERFIRRTKKSTPNYSPTISITAPTQQPFRTQERSYLIKAFVRNIQNSDQIDFVFNNETSYDFTYNSSTREFMAYVNLREGSNIFRINSNNSHGNEQASGTIIYEYQTMAATLEKPIIEMITPTTKVYTSDNQLYIKARLYNVFDVSDIVFSANGMACVDFSFDASTGILTSNQTLRDSYNYFTITASNEDGEATHTVEATLESTSISYLPVVSLIHPNMQSTTNQANVSVKASVKNITNRSQVTVKYNGKTMSNFLFSGGTYKYIEFEATNLNDGKNYVDITVRNADGQDKLTAVVTYNKPITRPVVTILSPTTNGQSINVQQKLVTLKAKVLHANNQQIRILLNGQEKAFQMLGNTLISKFDLRNGKNTIVVIANNGKIAQNTIVINYQATPKPTIILSNLKGNAKTKKKSFTVQGKIENVANASGIQVLVNNQVFTKYVFNPYTGNLTFTTQLQRGKNSIQVKATNTGGEVSNRSTIIYDDGTESFDGKK